MNCEVCGTELPHGALFCGECGRAVGTRSALTLHPDSGMPVDAEGAKEPEARRNVRTNPRDTAIIEPVVRSQLPELETELPFLPASRDIEQDLSPEVLEAESADVRLTHHCTSLKVFQTPRKRSKNQLALFRSQEAERCSLCQIVCT